MAKYHINQETGRANICNAKTPEDCKYYDKKNKKEVPHFESKEEAKTYIKKQKAMSKDVAVKATMAVAEKPKETSKERVTKKDGEIKEPVKKKKVPAKKQAATVEEELIVVKSKAEEVKAKVENVEIATKPVKKRHSSEIKAVVFRKRPDPVELKNSILDYRNIRTTTAQRKKIREYWKSYNIQNQEVAIDIAKEVKRDDISMEQFFNEAISYDYNNILDSITDQKLPRDYLSPNNITPAVKEVFRSEFEDWKKKNAAKVKEYSDSVEGNEGDKARALGINYYKAAFDKAGVNKKFEELELIETVPPHDEKFIIDKDGLISTDLYENYSKTETTAAKVLKAQSRLNEINKKRYIK